MRFSTVVGSPELRGTRSWLQAEGRHQSCQGGRCTVIGVVGDANALSHSGQVSKGWCADMLMGTRVPMYQSPMPSRQSVMHTCSAIPTARRCRSRSVGLLATLLQ